MFLQHDNTLTAFMKALQVFNYIQPPYASAIVVELYQNNVTNQYTVILLYKNETTTFYNLTLPGNIRVRNLKFARNLKFTTSKTLVNFMKKMMFLSKNWYFSVQKVLIYYTVNKSHHNSFILLVFSHVANFRYVRNFRFLTLLYLLKKLTKYWLSFK